jgi:hypothetical protein
MPVTLMHEIGVHARICTGRISVKYLAMIVFVLQAGLVPGTSLAGDDLGIPAASRFAGLALECVHKEYPNKISHTLSTDQDVRPPRELTPAFYGCFDWHSAVHGHWLLARLARRYPGEDFSALARDALGQSLNAENIAREVDYLQAEGRASFERPYGLAWLLQLDAELLQWTDEPMAAGWSRTLAPLVQAARERLYDWLPKLAYPIRVGEHSQTAFAFGLMLDWARIAGDSAMESLLVAKSREFYLGDRNCPLSYEPSGQDFLSPCLAEADLVRRMLPPAQYSTWLAAFLPDLPSGAARDWLPVGKVTDRSDGKLAHLDGLNISRAWMLEGIAMGLPDDDPRRPSIEFAAGVHRLAGLSAVTGEHYEGGHWLGSFAAYLVTHRGLTE